MSTSLIITSLLLIVASSQCGPWTATNPDNGGQVILDLTPLQNVTLNLTDSETPTHIYYYSICRNDETCYSQKVMTKMTSPYDPGACYILGRWDYSKQPQFENVNGGTWTFYYDNGEIDCGNPARTWSPRFVCDPSVKYKAGTVGEVPNSCFYEIEIHTRYACQNWTTTTTTTTPPDGECVFRSENGNELLNMTSIRGKLLSQVDPVTEYLYYMYTPCVNAAKCDDEGNVMAYIFDGMNFVCKHDLAVWEDGYVEPNYVEGLGMWQFTYTNGESCNGGETVFNVEWYCDKTATTPQVIQAKEIATCVYQMLINSTLACG